MKLRPPYISDMRIIDDFLDVDYHAHLHDILMGWEFPWFYQHTLTHGCDKVQAHGFNHWLSDDGDPDFAPLVQRMQDEVSAKECLRVRADMTLYNAEGFRHDFHVDSKEPHTVCIYYVNDTDGDTIILGDKNDHDIVRVQPKKNRLLTFNGRHMHTGHSPSKHKNRILINANFK